MVDATIRAWFFAAYDNIWLFNLLGKSNTSIGVRDEGHISDIAIMELPT
jgi:hypothetical protein